MPKLTVGMAVCGRPDLVICTIQALNIYHPAVRDYGEILVIDNDPDVTTNLEGDRPCGKDRGVQAIEAHCRGVKNCRYEVFAEKKGTAAPRQRIFDQAEGDIVVVLDAHVMLLPDAISKLLAYFDANPDSRDLLQGPWYYDSIQPGRCETHMAWQWRAGMFGTWAHDKRGDDFDGPVFEIPAHGLGLFACRRDAWPGFNPLFRGFGGEEGYIHEKFRRQGGKTLCAPWLGWWHCFKNTSGVPYRLTDEDKLWNYLVGAKELNHPAEHLMSAENAIKHFTQDIKTVRPERAAELWREVQGSVCSEAAVTLPRPLELNLAPAPPRIASPHVAREIVQTLKATPQPDNSNEEGENMDLPWVYCLMPTFGRATLARQAIAAFLRQDYPRKKLMILNTGEQPLLQHDLQFEHVLEIHEPGLQGAHGLPTLAELHWLLLQQVSDHEALVRHWDDDDLSLPWSISQGVAHMIGGAKPCLAWKPEAHWYEQAGRFIALTQNKCEGSVLFRRGALSEASYEPNATAGDLATLYSQLAANKQLLWRDFGPWSSYIYRFGVSPDHASGRPAGGSDPAAIQERLKYYREQHRDHAPDVSVDPNIAVNESFRRVWCASYPWQEDLRRRCLGEAPPVTHAGQPQDCVPDTLRIKFPDRQGLIACDVGRNATQKICEQMQVRLCYSFGHQSTLHTAVAALGPLGVKAKWLSYDFGHCSGCGLPPEPIDLLVLSDPDPVQSLAMFRKLQTRLSGICLICVPQWQETGAALLLRCVLDPTHTSETINGCLVFQPRVIPEWLMARFDQQKA
jgi:glycosyltransferase involved in cell wall biosynthesis